MSFLGYIKKGPQSNPYPNMPEPPRPLKLSEMAAAVPAPPVSEVPAAPIPAPEEEPNLEFPSLDIENIPEIEEIETNLPQTTEKAPEFKFSIPEPVSEEIPSELPELEPAFIPKIPKKMPLSSLFISIDNYKYVVEELNTAKAHMETFLGTPAKLNSIRVTKDSAFEKWRQTLEDCQRKLLYIDKILFEGG